VPASYDAIFERALAKDPAARYASAAEFVGDLRRGLHDDAGDTWIEPAATRVAAAAPAGRWWIPAALLVLLAAGAVAAIVASRGGGSKTAPQVTTIVRTVTTPAHTVQETVTAPTSNGADGVSLNNAGYAKLKVRDYQGALPLLQQAVAKLQGTGSTAEAYADYNLALTEYALGQCDDVVPLLDASERIQGHRPEIDKLRHEAQKGCGRG
jgi:tetratricopeptide (TPR) repeat protein